MSSFKNWLAQQAEKQVSPAQKRKLIDEWKKAVDDLLEQMVQWLREDDTQHVLTIAKGPIHMDEEGLGKYEIASMVVSLDKTIAVKPMARNVVGTIGKRDSGFRAEGRVDLTDGSRKYMLYHVVTPNGKKWVIVDDEDYSIRDLDKNTFEPALQDLLS